MRDPRGDPMFPVRAVLLMAAVLSMLATPWIVSAALFLAWILVGVWPRKKSVGCAAEDERGDA